MSEKSCESCLTYRGGECMGRGLCEFYEPAPTKGKEYWPSVMRSRNSYTGSGDSGFLDIYDTNDVGAPLTHEKKEVKKLDRVISLTVDKTDHLETVIDEKHSAVFRVEGTKEQINNGYRMLRQAGLTVETLSKS